MHVRIEGECLAVQAEFFLYDSCSVFFQGRTFHDNMRLPGLKVTLVTKSNNRTDSEACWQRSADTVVLSESSTMASELRGKTKTSENYPVYWGKFLKNTAQI